MRKLAITLGAVLVAALWARALAAEQQGGSQSSAGEVNERLRVFQSPTPPSPVPPWKAGADKTQPASGNMTQPRPPGGFSSDAATGAPAH